MQGYAMQTKEFVLNESFKALIEGIFSNSEQSKKLIQAFEEIVNDRATTQRLNFENLKQQAIDEIRQELVSKDLFQSEIKRLEDLFQLEIKRLENLIYSEVARLEGIINTKIAEVNTKIAEVKTEISEQISSAKQKALYWLLGTAVATTVTILSGAWAMMNFMLEALK
ncbi:TPA: hypothetical protein SHD19_001642 [Campylobacter coli]|uniref:hypothetical protein n=2 Tax=Campylobacter coli TaxID=195 RepID=UPI00073F3531|nr:hypothetical protein [Campylobacter coli]HEB7570093.1 hypothetical protein [Campylobacter coli]HEB9306478.1 hypothetical protein [Campylobacter coli]HEB9318352.1 hypothetical protein [Campylobacter coli]HED6632371.1 hypothetical protein [Campylobacter coli]HED6852179.1 hypothetical protein [Campylobacter coli]